MLKELKARARRERSPSPEARTIEIETKQGHAYSIQDGRKHKTCLILR